MRGTRRAAEAESGLVRLGMLWRGTGGGSCGGGCGGGGGATVAGVEVAGGWRSESGGGQETGKLSPNDCDCGNTALQPGCDECDAVDVAGLICGGKAGGGGKAEAEAEAGSALGTGSSAGMLPRGRAIGAMLVSVMLGLGPAGFGPPGFGRWRGSTEVTPGEDAKLLAPTTGLGTTGTADDTVVAAGVAGCAGVL